MAPIAGGGSALTSHVFSQRLEEHLHWDRPNRVLRIAPVVTRLPLPMRRYDDPFLPFGKAIIKATRDLVAGYVFDLAAYLSIGAAGAIALERTLSYLQGHPLTVLHGPFTGAGFASISDENAFECTALTVTHETDTAAYLSRPDRGVFLIRANGCEDMPEDLPGLGCYAPDYGVMSLALTDNRKVRLSVLGDDWVYATSGDDFAEALRAALLVDVKGGA